MDDVIVPLLLQQGLNGCGGAGEGHFIKRLDDVLHIWYPLKWRARMAL